MEKKAMYGLPVTGYAKAPASGRCIPILGGKMMSNADWVRECIKSREDHPELYSGQDISAVLSQQRELLKRLEEEERAAGQHSEEWPEIVEIDPRRMVKL